MEPSTAPTEPAPAALSLNSHDEDVERLTEAVRESRARFERLVAERPAYVYTSHDASFSGHSWSYRLTVDHERVTRREYEARDDGGKRIETWVEAEPAVGEHPGGPTTGLAALYDQCLGKVLTRDPADHELFVEIGDDGLMSACLYVRKGCMDDCSEGPRVSAVEWR